MSSCDLLHSEYKARNLEHSDVMSASSCELRHVRKSFSLAMQGDARRHLASSSTTVLQELVMPPLAAIVPCSYVHSNLLPPSITTVALCSCLENRQRLIRKTNRQRQTAEQKSRQKQTDVSRARATASGTG